MYFSPKDYGGSIEDSLEGSRRRLKKRLDRAVPGIWKEHKFTPVARTSILIDIVFFVLKLGLVWAGFFLYYRYLRHHSL